MTVNPIAVAIILVIILGVFIWISASQIPIVKIYSASLNGAQEVPPVVTTSNGDLRGTITGSSFAYEMTATLQPGFELLYAHFHLGPAGTNGPIVKTVSPNIIVGRLVDAGVWGPSDDEPLTPELLSALKAGNIYVNVHSYQYPDGEIRGQIRG